MPRQATATYQQRQKEAIQSARSQLQELGLLAYELLDVRLEVRRIYGSFSDDTWRYWLRKVQASADAPLGMGKCSNVTRHLLRCNAMWLRGNSSGCAKRQLKCEALAQVAIAMSEADLDTWLASHGHIPDQMSALELEEYIELLSMRTYDTRTYRRWGIFRRKSVYRKPEIVDILERAHCA